MSHLSHLTHQRRLRSPTSPGSLPNLFLVWTPVRLGVACAGIVAMLATSGCSGSDPQPDATASSETVTTPTTASPDDVFPTTPTTPTTTSQAAGIPTAKPSPASTPAPTTLNASVLITLATVDPDTGGMLLGGYVSGVTEDGGDCQYVVTNASGDSMTIHKDGVANNGSTSCGSTTVSRSSAPAGSYTVILRYTNDIGQVESDAVEVDVP